MAELLYNINFSRLSTPLHFSPRPHFCFTRFAPLRRRFSHSSILVKLSSASSQLDIISATENSDGSIIFKFGDASELSQSVEGFDVQNEEILESESNRNLALQDNAVTDDDDESDGTKADILVINSFQAKEIANEPVDSRIKSEFVSQSGEDSVVDEQISNTIPIANEPAPSYKTVSLSDAESSSDAVSDEQNSDLTSTANVDALVDSQIDPRFDVQSYEVSVSDFGEVESSSDFDTVELENQIINNMVATCDSYVEVVMIEKAEELTEVSEDMSVDDKLEYDGDELSVVLEEIKGSGKLEYRVDKIPVIASEDKIDGGDEMSVIASKAASVDGGEISTIASEEASDDGDKMLAIGSKEVSDDGDEAIASEEAILDGDEMSPIASEEANDDEMSAIASKDTTADDKLEYGGEESNTVASERSNGGAKVEYGGDDLPEETSDGCDKSLVNDSVEMKYADKVEYGGDTVSFVASKEINDGEEVEYVGDEILAIASEDTNDKVEYVGDETLAIASEDTVDKVEYVGDETLAIASEDTIDKIEYVGDKILAIASEDTNDKVEYVGDSASSFIVSEEINNGAKVEYVGDETLVIALGDSIDDDKVEYGGEETLAISSEEMIDGGKLECSNNDSLSIVPEEMVDDGKLDSGDVDSLNIASNETCDVRKVISVSEELSNISETSMVVQSEDEIVEPEADAVAADKEVELISPPLEAEPILDEERDFESLAGVITVASTLGFDKAHHMTTPSISQSDEFSDILLAAGPITSDINSVDFDSPNEVESSAPTFFITSAAASLSHSLEALTGGKDAYFVSEEWFGVADGVGQWSLEGIDVGLYAHELMQNCQKLLKSNAGITDVKDLFQQSDAMTQSTGSARVIIAYVANQVLHVANIGDTGFMIIRNGALFKKSSPMLHDFGFPYAIGLGDDSVEDVEEDHIELEGGDVIVTATDGLFDNLYEQEIVFTVSKALEAGIHVQELAELLATKAQEVGKSENTRSPFADAAQAAGHPGYSGGKFDHVTVIVSLVQTR